MSTTTTTTPRSTATTPAVRRPKLSQAEINSQLQQLFLTSTSSTSSSTSSTSSDPVGGGGGNSSYYSDLDSLAPILIQISRTHQQDGYLRALRQFVRDKELEIEALCHKNYQDFVSSVSQLLRVRQGTVSLKHRVVELNRDVQESGKKVADKKRALLEARRVGQNIDETIDTLQACLRVLDLSSKIQHLISPPPTTTATNPSSSSSSPSPSSDSPPPPPLATAAATGTTTTNKKYFSGLRQLQDLERIELRNPPVAQFPFANLMSSSIPETRRQVKDSVTKSLKSWMFEAREKSKTVGRGALENMEHRGRRWNSRKRKEGGTTGSTTGGGGGGLMRLAKINGPVELGVSERYEYNALDNDQVSIDFKPLYTCIHIYTTLDLLEDLQLSYQADRRAQAYLLLSTFSTSSSSGGGGGGGGFSLTGLSTLLEEIVGFFLIESHVLKTTFNFRSEQDVESLWDGMCERVVEVVDEGLKDEQDPQVFLGTKFKVLTFVQTLEGYGYSVSALHSLLLTLFSRYSQLLQRKFSGDFEQIVLDDDHQPMVVNDRQELDKVVTVSWLPSLGEWSKEELSKPGFPLALPFSQTYPLCCIDIRSFTEQYYQFSEGFAEHHRDIDDVLRKALDNLLIQQVSENIQRRLTQVSNLSQLSQIVVNVLFFKTACQDLETLLVTLRATQRGGTIHLESLNSFNQTLVQTQDRIVSQISLKIDSFFEEAEYPWTTTTPPPQRGGVTGGEASGYLMDLMDFISTIMMSVLIQLPEFAKDYVYRGALSYCSMVLTSFLTDKEPRMISDQGLQYLNRDVKWLVEHVKSLGNDHLLDVFSELDQTLNLLTNYSVPLTSLYLDKQTRTTRYPLIDDPKRVLQPALIKLSTFYNHSPSSSQDVRRKVGVEELLRAISR